MTRASQLKNNPKKIAIVATARVFSRTFNNIIIHKPPVTAKLTHAARVKEKIVPMVSQSPPANQRTFWSALWSERHAMANTAGSIMARTAP